MAIKIRFDNENRAISPTLVLATRSGHKLGCIPAQHIVLHGSMANGYELSCTVSKYDNWEKVELWDELEDFKLLWSPEWDVWFEIDVTTSETDETTKNIAAVSVGEAELSQVMLYNIEINTETDIARGDYKPTIIYNSEDPSASLLDRIMEKTPHYSIRHVDASIAKLQRTFSFDNKSLRDALLEICKEVNALLIIHSGTDENGKIERAFSIYDLEEHCPSCGYRGRRENGVCPECGKTEWSFGYGEDTGIFVSRENLADNITYETEKDSVKNCFRLVAGDDLMTAAVASVNPNGTNYLWYVSDKVRKDMSPALRTRLNQYDELYQSAQDNTYSLGSPAIDSYNALAEKYGKEQINDAEKFPGLLDAYYDTIDFKLYLEHELLPDVDPPITSAADELKKLIANISPVSVRSLTSLSSTTATSYVTQAARTIIDPRYSVTTKDETLNGDIWSGSFIISRYSDEEDTATSEIVSAALNDDYENYIRRQIDRVLNTSEFEDLDIVALFEKDDTGFISEIKKYSLAMLKSFYDACQACLNVLVEHNAANESTWADIYNNLYTPYYSKLGYLQTEITIRESEISTIEKAQSEIGAIIASVQESLDFEKFMGEELWLEFAAYRREDTYQNDNYISDGLDNAALVKNAREFVDTAQEEIERSATLQHSISSTLSNLLVMEEFKDLTDKFETSNWIRIKVDDKVYILRLIDYEIDFDNPDSLEVEYSDVVSSSGCINDIKSILDSASSMSTSYGSVSRQAKHGDTSNKELNSWVTDGLEVTKVRFMSDAEEQNITWGENGMLFRKWDEVTQAYEPTQLRIINSTIAVTDDNWKTVKTAVGGFDYKDPVSGEIKHGYGINAELLIGKLILGENLGLYNEANSLTFDSNGLNVSNNVNSFTVSPNGDTLLSLKKGKDNIFWVDSDGGLHLSPTEFTLTTGKNLEGVLSDLDKATKDAQNLQIILTNEYEGVPTDANGNYNGELNIKTGVITYYGAVDVTNDCIYEVAVPDVIEGNWNLTAHEYTITALSADSGYVDITASYKDKFKVTKRFNVSKVKAGTNGEDGRGIASVTVSYTLSEQGDTPPSSGWQTSMPSLTAGSYLWTRTETVYTDNSPSTISYSVGRIGENGVKGDDGIGIKNTEISYQKGDLGTVAPTGIWSDTIPTVQPGEYLWTRTKLTYTDNSVNISYSVSMMGTQGIPGETSYLHIKYMTKENYDKFIVNNDDPTIVMIEDVAEYMGIYTDYNEDDSTLAKSYKWAKVQGTDGHQGSKGENGQTSYLHIKYSNDGGASLTDNYGEDTGAYLGQYTDFEVTDSLDVTKYIWSKIEGEKGTPGVSSYLHIRYAPNDHPTAAEMSTEPSEYIGTYVDNDATDSTDPNKYKWAKLMGTDGQPGSPGNDGQTSYLHIKYSNDGGQSFTGNDGEDVGAYIGQYTDFTQADSTNPTDYKWSRIEGIDGESARVFIVESSADVVCLKSDGTVSPKTISFNLYSRVGNGQDRDSYTNVYLHFYYSIDGTEFLGYEHILPDPEVSGMSVNISSLMESHPDIKAFRFIANDSTDSTTLDMKTIPVIADGKDGAEMTPEEVFNKLTNYGAMEGVFVTEAGENGEPGHVYINGTYIQADTISGDLIKGGTIEGVTIKGNTIDGNIIKGGSISSTSISGTSFTSSATKTVNSYVGTVNYTTTLTINNGTISGVTFPDNPSISSNSASITFDQPFSSGNMNYYSLNLASSHAISLDTPQIYIRSSQGFSLGQTGTIRVLAWMYNPYTGQYGEQFYDLTFNKGIMTTALPL